MLNRRLRANSVKNAKDFKVCANCKGFYSRITPRKHFLQCTGRISKLERAVILLYKKTMGRINEKAPEVVRKYLFPPLRENIIVRAIR